MRPAVVVTFVDGTTWTIPAKTKDADEQARALGGPGSGNFGHVGRPGLVGGSGDRNVLSAAEVSGEQADDIERKAHAVTGNSNEAVALHEIDASIKATIDPLMKQFPPRRAAFLTDSDGRIVAGGWAQVDYANRAKIMNIGAFSARDEGWITDELAAQLKELDVTEIRLPPLRAAGGPGSGFYDHAGRPGLEGGSAPSAAARQGAEDIDKMSRYFDKAALIAGVKPTGETVSKEQFDARMNALGFKTVSASEVNPTVVEMMGLREPSIPFDAAAMRGIERGVKDIEKISPKLYKKLQENVIFVYGEQDNPAVATTASPPAHQQYIILNASDVAQSSMRDPELTENTVATKRAKMLGLEGDAAVEEAFRGVVVHEIGHVFDVATGHILTDMVVGDVARTFGRYPPSERTKRMRESLIKISNYAAIAGPNEATAEIFTAALLKYPLPKEYHNTRDEILKMKDAG